MKSILKNRFVKFLLLPFTALVLEIIPYSAVLVFGHLSESGQVERVTSYCSYFSLLPFGYGNFAPLITAVLTCVLILVTAAALWKNGNRWKICAKWIGAMAAVTSVFPIFLFMYSFPGLLISLCLFAQWWLLAKSLK